MRSRWTDVHVAPAALVALLSACPEHHETCDVPSSCASRSPDEWANAPPGAPSLVPERVVRWDEEPVVEATFLAVPTEGGAQRITYRLGLDHGTVAVSAVEPVDGDWARDRLASLDLDSALACVPLASGDEIRALPSRAGGETPAGEFFGTSYAAALRRTGPRAASFDVWLPAASPSSARDCSRALVIEQPSATRRLRCGYHPGEECPGSCLPGEWHCTRTGLDSLDALDLCEPR